MLPVPIRIAMFLGLWFESARYFEMGADGAFLLTGVVFFGTWWVQAYAVELAGLSAPLTAMLLARGAMWIVLFGWLAPDFLKSQPVTIIAAGAIAIVFAGARARGAFDARGYTFDKPFFQDRSGAVVGCVMAALALAFLVQQRLGSVLPLLGYAALLGLPFSFGWQVAGPQPQTKYDAYFGDEDMWHDVGASDEF